MTQKYVKKPIVIEAMMYGPKPVDGHKLVCWMSNNLYPGLIGNALEPETLRYPDQAPTDKSRPDKGWWIDPADGALMIRTLEGDMRATPGDYIIKGVKGEFYPCKPDIFEQSYDKAEEE